MKPKPYTDEEIVALLEDGRLAATSIRAAQLLAVKHSKHAGEVQYAEKEIPGFKDFIRISIPRPPKRRALRREDGGKANIYIVEPQEPLVISTEGGE